MGIGRLALASRLLLAFITALVASAAASPDAAVEGRVPVRLAHPPDRLQDGDLVFRKGRDLQARLVLSQDQDAHYSHVGMVVLVDGIAKVVHSAPSETDRQIGVRVESIAAFTAAERAESVGYFRVEGMSREQQAIVTHFAMSQIDKPFDYEFRYSDDTAMYCTELVGKALARAGIDLERTSKRVHVLLMQEPALSPDTLSRDPALVRLDRF